MSWIRIQGYLKGLITIWTGPKAGWVMRGEGWNVLPEAPKQTVSLPSNACFREISFYLHPLRLLSHNCPPDPGIVIVDHNLQNVNRIPLPGI